MPRHPRIRAATGSLLGATLLAACGSEPTTCGIADIAEREPEALAQLPEEAQGSVRDAYLLHEQDDYAFYAGDPVDEQADICLLISSGGELMSIACSVGWVETTVGTEVRAAYDTGGDVAGVAAHLEAVDECLAVRTNDLTG